MTELARNDAASHRLLQIRRIDDEHGVVLALQGELDVSTAPELGAQLAEIEGGNPTSLLIDLSELEFMDSTGLTVIIRTRDRAAASGCRLLFRLGSPQVKRLLTLTGVLDHLTLVE
jgi:anti-anti-sigma factor